MTHAYDFRSIEPKWQDRWATRGAFRAAGPGEPGHDPDRPKFYVLDMFPYPSGVGLHVGHPLGYIATDIVARYKRMTGHHVMHPMGFDAFGLPAEQYAIETGVHPRQTTERNIDNMRRQLKAFGLSYDWDREVSTTRPDYYKWTQWIFLQLYNSYFDPIDQRARPIADLVQQLEAEEYYVSSYGELVANPAEGLEGIQGDPIGARKWHELDRYERRDVLDGLRLAYLDEVPVNWCPALGTVLANEEVTAEGRSERGNHPVHKRPLRQWMLRITAYADRLIDDLDRVDWPEPIRQMQRHWVGRSEGALVDFTIDGHDDAVLTVFTTRPDTLFGATYMVLAPEHPLVDEVTTKSRLAAVDGYRAQAAARTDIDRQAEAREKTGVFTGGHAVNPLSGEKIPIWIADYVLMGYGTGAIMAVPAHDARDFEFARRFELPIKPVVMPDDGWLRTQAAEAGWHPGADDVPDAALPELRDRYLADPAAFPEAFVGEGAGVQSENDEVSINGLPTDEAKDTINRYLGRKEIGQKRVQYRLRDWLFSRQRYWGEPFPILHSPDGEIVPLDEDDLPVTLPELDDFSPQAPDDPDAPPQPPLSRAPDSWKYVERDGVRYTREFNTMPQWAGSCWYYLRYLDPRNDKRFVDPKKERYWMRPHGVDLYVGGAEHAVLHLLYSRFWHKVLYDLGHVSTPEPFGKLFNQGYIQAHAYTDERGVYVPAEEVEEKDGAFFYQGKPVRRTYGKMGKSLKNAVNPDDIFEEYGCDTLRLYEMYLGPLEASKPWNTRDIIGVHRFLQRVWRNFVDPDSGAVRVTDDAPDEALARRTHRTIARVTDDMERMSFNTAIAALIELNNGLVGLDAVPREVAEPFLLMLAPLAPHIAEELWERTGHAERSPDEAGWPVVDAAMLAEDTVEVVVQVLGKVRGRVSVAADADEQTVKGLALELPNVKPHVEGKTIRKVIYVPGKLLNIVAN